MAAWTNISASKFDTGEPILGSTHLQMSNNITALAEGASGAPTIMYSALQTFPTIAPAGTDTSWNTLDLEGLRAMSFSVWADNNGAGAWSASLQFSDDGGSTWSSTISIASVDGSTQQDFRSYQAMLDYGIIMRTDGSAVHLTGKTNIDTLRVRRDSSDTDGVLYFSITGACA